MNTGDENYSPSGEAKAGCGEGAVMGFQSISCKMSLWGKPSAVPLTIAGTLLPGLDQDRRISGLSNHREWLLKSAPLASCLRALSTEQGLFARSWRCQHCPLRGLNSADSALPGGLAFVSNDHVFYKMLLKGEGEWLENTESHKAGSKSWATYHPESHC